MTTQVRVYRASKARRATVTTKGRPSSRTLFVESLEPRSLLAGAAGQIEMAAHPAHSAGAADLSRIADIGSRVGSAIEQSTSKTPSDTILHEFGGTIDNSADGWQPWGSLTLVHTSKGAVIFGRTLYGGSSDDGVIFTMKPDGSDYTIVHTFTGGANDGSQPHHDQLRQDGNELFGATLMGGSSDEGVVFSIKTDGTGFKVLHSFAGGTTDGSFPHSNPMPDGKVLYGLTSLGGSNNEGTIYQMKTDGSGYKVLYSFKKSDGTQPHGFVIVVGHDLFGMTRQDGEDGDGSIFEYDLKSGKYIVLHQFTGASNDGSTPDHGGLVLVGKKLYGVTTEGGSDGDGVMLSIDTSGKHFHVLHSFGGQNDGSGPHGSLYLSGGRLYGMTSDGGTDGDGTIFEYKLNGKGYKSIYNFAGPTTDGQDGLDNVLISNGTIYGMTKYGGSISTPGSALKKPTYQNGVIFSLPLASLS